MDTINYTGWEFDRLLSRKGHAAVKSLQEVILAIADHHIFLEGLVHINASSRGDFKQTSNQGFVWHHRRLWDLGNWSYTVLYQWIAKLVPDRPQSAEVLAQLEELWQHYESLHPKWARTEASCCMKGDVIEACLAPCRLTSFNVEAAVVQHRVAFNALLVRFWSTLEDVYRICFRNDSGPPTLKQCPDPDRFVKTLRWALVLMAPPSSRGSGCTTEYCEQQFTLSSELATASISDKNLWYSI